MIEVVIKMTVCIAIVFSTLFLLRVFSILIRSPMTVPWTDHKISYPAILFLVCYFLWGSL